MFLMWLGEQITQRGIGNGISLIIFSGIVAEIPRALVGNYTFGIKEHIIFPEVNFDKVEKIRGLDITIVIKSTKKNDSYELLKKLNFPFKNKRSN